MNNKIEEINKNLDYATKFFNRDCKQMHEKAKSIEKQIAELLEAHSEKTRTLIRTINLEWMDLSSMNKEIKKVRAVNIDARTDIL